MNKLMQKTIALVACFCLVLSICPVFQVYAEDMEEVLVIEEAPVEIPEVYEEAPEVAEVPAEAEPEVPVEEVEVPAEEAEAPAEEAEIPAPEEEAEIPTEEEEEPSIEEEAEAPAAEAEPEEVAEEAALAAADDSDADLRYFVETSEPGTFFDISSRITLSADLTLPVAHTIRLLPGGELIVPAGVTLTNSFVILLHGGFLTLDGGTYTESGYANLEAQFMAYQQPYSCTNVGLNYVTFVLAGTNVSQDSVMSMFRICDVAESVTFRLSGELHITKDMDLPRNAMINGQNLSVYLENGAVVNNYGIWIISCAPDFIGLDATNGVFNNYYIVDRNGESLNESVLGVQNVHGVPDLVIDDVVQVASEAEFMAATSDGYKNIEVIGNVEITKQLMALPQNTKITVLNGGTLTVRSSNFDVTEGCSITICSGASFENDSVFSLYTGSEMTIEAGAAWASRGGISLGGKLNAAEMPTVFSTIKYAAYDDPVTDPSAVTNLPKDMLTLSPAAISTMDALEAACRNGVGFRSVSATVMDGLVISRDITIPANVRMWISYSTVEVASGVTVTNEGTIRIAQDGVLTNNGTLVNNGTVEIFNNGQYIENGSFQGYPISDGTPSTPSTGPAVQVDSEAAFFSALANGSTNIEINGNIQITQPNTKITVQSGTSLTIADGISFGVSNGSAVTICSGATFTNNGFFTLNPGTELTIEAGATWVRNRIINLGGGKLNSAVGSPENSMIRYRAAAYAGFTDSSEATNLPKNTLQLNVSVLSLDELEEAFRLGAEFGRMELDINADLYITKDLTIPSNAELKVWASLVDVAAGVTVTNNGYIQVGPYSLMQNNGTVVNQGTISLFQTGQYFENGTFQGNPISGGTPSTPSTGPTVPAVQVDNEAAFLSALANGSTNIEITGSVEITQQVQLPQDTKITVQSGAGLFTRSQFRLTPGSSVVVKDGGTFENSATFILGQTSELIIENGAKWANYNLISLSGGKLTAANVSGPVSYINYEFRNYQAMDTTVATNLPKNMLILCPGQISTQADLEHAILEGVSFRSVNGAGVHDLVITSDITVPGYFRLFMQNTSMTIMPGVTLTNQGSIEVGQDGILENNGTIINQEQILLFNNGQYIENGTLQGNPVSQAGQGGQSGPVQVTTEQELLDAMAAEREVQVATEITVNGDLNVTGIINLVAGGNLHVLGDLTNNRVIHLVGGYLDVQGAYSSSGELWVYAHSYGNPMTDATNVSLSEAIAQKSVTSLRELKNALSTPFFGNVLVLVEADFDITEDLTIPANAYVHFIGPAQNGMPTGCHVTVPTDVVLINEGGFTVACGSVLEINGTLADLAGYYVNTDSKVIINGTVTDKIPTGPKITRQPMSVRIDVDGTATFSVDASGNALTYQWQYKTPTGVWANCSSSTMGYRSNTIEVAAKLSRNGYQYRCVIKDADGNVVESAPAELTVLLPLQITAQPADQSVTVGETATFSVTATSSSSLTYQWQYMNATGTWANCSSATAGYHSDTLTPVATAARNGYQYRCVIKDANGNTVTSEPATLTVAAALAITQQPADQSVTVGETATFSVTASGTGLTYQWQYMTSTGTWANCSSATAGYHSDTLTPAATAARNGYQYRCVIKDKSGNTLTSEPATLTVAAALAITKQPANQSVAVGETATFSVTASGTGLTYQWQYMTSTGTWANCSSATAGYRSATLTPQATAARNGYQYRCVIKDKSGNTLTSEPATLTVAAAFAITKQPADQSVAVGETATFSVTASGTGLTYQWQYMTSTGTWANCSSATTGYRSATLTPKATTARNGYQYRCIVKDSNGKTLTSDAATLTISTGFEIVKQPENAGFITVGDMVSFSVTAVGSGLTYQWQYKTSTGNWTNCSSATQGYRSATLQVVSSTARESYKYRCVIKNSTGETLTSQEVNMYHE